MNVRTLACAVITLSAYSSLLAQGGTPRIDRYWGEFEIARVQLTAEPFDGGAGAGLSTNWVPIFAQAVVRVEEAQNFTWEWLGVTAPGQMELEGFPNLSFTGFSDDTVEYRELTMDLNPIAPNVWGSAEAFDLAYPALTVTGTYQSFSTETTFNAEYKLRLPNQDADYSFSTVVSRVNFSRFPDELSATVIPDPRAGDRVGRRFAPENDAELEPRLRLGAIQIQQFRRPDADETGQMGFPFSVGARGVTLLHTPSGDANNDGTVSFADLLILSTEFGMTQNARWEDGDFDGDGGVGFGDFLMLSENFGQVAAVSIPEPSGIMLAIFGAVALGGGKGKKRVQPM